jgi:predicted esterase
MLILFRYFLLALGILIGLPLLIFLILIPKTPISSVGILYLLAYILIALGLVGAPWWARRSTAFILVGSMVTIVTMTVRLLSPPRGTQMYMMTLPGQSGPRLVNRILNEQDAVMFGSQVGPYIGFISPAEQKSLIPEFSRTFNEMKSRGATPLSPFLATYLKMERPDAFDTVVAEPISKKVLTTGIIFLHGYGGNFTVQCWLIAKAGLHMEALTVCPSTGPQGSWWDSQGESILKETVAYLHGRGITRIYLAGLSNGAIGASRLVSDFENDFAGLILISGADPSAAMTKLPVLLLHGKYDERIPVSLMERYVSAPGSKATYFLFESDHFLLLKQADEVQNAIAGWLSQQESIRQSR